VLLPDGSCIFAMGRESTSSGKIGEEGEGEGGGKAKVQQEVLAYQKMPQQQQPRRSLRIPRYLNDHKRIVE
jgi:hypothetical protein